MLVAAALVPDTALLVRGAGGASGMLDALRAAALEAVTESVAAPVERVVVVAPAPAVAPAAAPAPAHRNESVDRELRGTVHATLAPAGVPDHLLPDAPPSVSDGVLRRTPAAGPGEVPAVGTAIALRLLAGAGWAGPVELLEVARPGLRGTPGRGDELRARGRALVGAAPTALVVVGSASGRHGPDAPLADDDRAPAHDARLLGDLAGPDPAALARLAKDDESLAHELAITGWAPWQVLVGAVDDTGVTGRLLRAEVVAGAQHAVLVWRCA